MKKYKLTLDEINSRVRAISQETLELATLDQIYEGKDGNLIFKHICGFEFERSVGNVIHNKVVSCPSCSPSKFNRTVDMLKKRFEPLGLKLISADDGCGDRKYALVELKCGCRYRRNIGALLANNVLCPTHTVGYNSQLKISEISKRLKQLPYGSFSIYGHYQTTTKHCDFICDKCGHKDNTKASLIIARGGKCKFCFGSAKSIREEFLAILLHDLGVEFIREYRLDGYYYDFYLPEYNVLVEYDGEQHFKDIGSNIFSMSNNDDIKNTIANKFNLKMLRLNETNCITTTILELLKGSTTIPQGSTPKQVETQNTLGVNAGVVI